MVVTDPVVRGFALFGYRQYCADGFIHIQEIEKVGESDPLGDS